MNALVVAAVLALSAHAADFDHAAWDAILKAHVNDAGEVDYAAIKANPTALDAYVRALAESSPDNRKELFPTSSHELAYWMNAYNALVTKGVAARYPTRSVRDLGFLFGFFRRADYTLGGRKMSLMTLEHTIIRARYKDPRIHFAIVCASISCPKLDRDAFRGGNLDEHLDRITRNALAERRMVSVDLARNTLTLTALLKWYAADFGDVLAFINKYGPAPARSLTNPKLRYFDYDWSINDPGSRARSKEPSGVS